MKLKSIIKIDPVERLALRMHQSFIQMLTDYRAFYEAQTGHPISASELVEQMGKQFMTEDKEFQKFLKARAQKPE